MRAAVPRYVPATFEAAPPGHRYRLYLAAWNDSWSVEKDEKKDVIAATARALDASEYAKLAHRLVERQRTAARSLGEAAFTLDARSTAPFVTGVGAEHPLENGFAFLDPYGAPYLPGSSVKGVVRRAAEELTLFEPTSGWTLADLWWLFGFDATSAFINRGPGAAKVPELEDTARQWREAYEKACGKLTPDIACAFLEAASGPDLESKIWRGDPIGFLRSLASNSSDAGRHARALHLAGSLRFSDVIVVPENPTLRVDIVNPHHRKYYDPKDGMPEAPGDFRPPQPIFFLALPPGARFTFVVELFGVSSLTVTIRQRWRDLLRGAIEHACTCLGFGAKTAVGYGALQLQMPGQRAGTEAPGAGATTRAAAAPPAGPSALERFIREVEALPHQRLPGTIDSLVRRALEFVDPAEQREAARAIVKKYTLKEARRKAREREDWKRIVELAGEG